MNERERDIDPKGFMTQIKKDFYHVMLYEEDVIRNRANMEEVYERRIWNMVMKVEEIRRQANPNFGNFLYDEQNPFVIIEKLLENAKALLVI